MERFVLDMERFSIGHGAFSFLYGAFSHRSWSAFISLWSVFPSVMEQMFFDRRTQRIDRQAHLGHSQDIGIDFGVAAKSLSERRRKFQWIETRKRNGLKRGGASD